MNRSRHLLLLALVGGTALLSGCATTPDTTKTSTTAGQHTPPKPPPRPVVPTPLPTPPPAPVLSPDQLALNDGIDLYNKGQFAEAIKRLSGPEITSGTVPNQVAAAKYLAFSYCLTNRATQCKQQFDKAFKLDPNFDLAPGEHGHPLWGKVFARAKPVVKK